LIEIENRFAAVADTRGGAAFTIAGANFGPPGTTTLSALYGMDLVGATQPRFTTTSCVVLAPGHVASEALAKTLQEHVKSVTAPYKYPRRIEFVDQLPKTVSGKIRRVDVSVDGGRNWRTARLESPVLGKCLTRFSLDWAWDGKPALVQSRATDDTGYVQPSFRQLRAVRGSRSIYHNNAVQTWLVQTSGEVSNVQLA
jgi:hypothetical protein